MGYLDFEALESIDPVAYQATKPYPWLNPAGIIRPEGYAELVETLPDVSLFEPVFGKARKFGQKSHDRYTLEYREGLPLSPPWTAFMGELRSDRYREALRRIIGVRSLDLSFHWHYTPPGCSVSPHCDATWKLGSHIFYFNTEADWKPEWGGDTVVLDDAGRFKRGSAPEFEDFDHAVSSEAIGNYSLLFTRSGNSWHGVREIRCPEGLMRKVLIAVIRRDGPLERVQRLFGANPRGY
jgi:hypothetical protein